MERDTVYILAIESSCDDTSVAILKNKEVLSNVVATQKIHEKYGGVVPELASRAHQSNIVPTVEVALKEAGITKEQLSAIAFTQGPGLMGSLLVGCSFAKSMAFALDIPLIAVHHMHAHLLAHFIEDGTPVPNFPFIGLTISGGHTQLVQVNSPSDMKILGETTDDAVGEAYDKTAKLLGFPYPGGPYIDRYAQKGTPKFPFTKPKVGELDFSFSGLKTQILYFIQNNQQKNPQFIEENLEDICASVQQIIIDIIVEKVIRACELTGIQQVAIGGGVSANQGIREALSALKQTHGIEVLIPKKEWTTDNAAMIGIVGYFKYLENEFATLDTIAQPRLKV